MKRGAQPNLASLPDLGFAADGHSLSRFRAGLSFYRIKLAILFLSAVSCRSSCSQYTSVRVIVRQNSGDSERIALCMRHQTLQRLLFLLFPSTLPSPSSFYFPRESDYSIESEVSAFNARQPPRARLKESSPRLRAFFFVLSRLLHRTSGNYIFIGVTRSRYNRIEYKNVSSSNDRCHVLEHLALSCLLNDLSLLSRRWVHSSRVFLGFKPTFTVLVLLLRSFIVLS